MISRQPLVDVSHIAKKKKKILICERKKIERWERDLSLSYQKIIDLLDPNILYLRKSKTVLYIIVFIV